ncbi:hypothetical protein [Vibrio diazotrophicus]|uniref:hypothetical protein n=1 Tax=Vibrio diazotrophicus TaxID=685 RepID=UPI003D2F84F5
MGNQVRGSYWQDDKKRFVKSRRKQFKYVTHKLVPEISFPRSANSDQVYQTRISVAQPTLYLGVEQAQATYIVNCRFDVYGRYGVDRIFKASKATA